MALPMIETGYKPEFGLGAVYQGFNAANADMSAQEELIKQFLANQREQQMQPLDVEKAELTNRGMGFDMSGKKLNSMQAEAQMTPELLRGFVGSVQAKQDEAIRNNEVGAAKHPFILGRVKQEQDTITKNTDVMNQLAQIDSLLANGGIDQFGKQATPEQMNAWQQERNRMLGIIGFTPEQWAKANIENIQGGWRYDTALDSQKIAAASARDAATIRATSGGDGSLKAVQKDVTTLETNHTKLTKQLSDQNFINSMTQLDPSGATLELLRSEHARVGTQLQQKRAELQQLLYGANKAAPSSSVSVSTSTTKPTTDNSLQTQVEASGVAFEPDKYEYRVVDGKVQRKPKGN